jgi:hypothetical protein
MYVPRETYSYKEKAQRHSELFLYCRGAGNRSLQDRYTFWLFSFILHKIAQKVFDPGHKTQTGQTQGLTSLHFVGEPGIEPGPHGPKPRTLPLCYTPNIFCFNELCECSSRAENHTILL